MTVDWALLRIRADEQADLLSRGQCLAAGMSTATIRWRLESRRWVQAAPGVYLTKPGRRDPHTAIWSTLLIADPRVDPDDVQAAVAGFAAAFLWDLTPSAPTEVQLVVPAARHLRAMTPSPLRIGDFDERTVSTLVPARTTLDATVLACAAAGSADDALSWVARAVQARRTTSERLATELNRFGRHRHGGLLRECLGLVAEGAESAAEIRYIRDVEQAHGLPTALRQLNAATGRYDNAYVDHQLIVEVDGRLGHEQWEDHVKDQRRGRRAAAGIGWTTRVYWQDVAITPCVTACEIGPLLRKGQWRAEVRPCRRADCAVRQAA